MRPPAHFTCVRINVQHIGNQPEDVLVEASMVPHVFQFFSETLHVWDTGQEDFRFLHGGTEVIFLQCTPEFHVKVYKTVTIPFSSKGRPVASVYQIT